MKYDRSDDGKVIDGKVVVWISPNVADPGPAPANKREAAKQATAAAAAAALQDAAKSGVPFCEECEAARRKQEALKK